MEARVKEYENEKKNSRKIENENALKRNFI